MEAFALPQVLKRDPTAASGRCLIPAVTTDTQAESILNQYKIATDDARPAERLAIARGLAQVQALLGKPASFAGNVRFSFAARKGYSSYDGFSGGRHQIRMNRCDSKGKNCAANNVAHLMHELGHKVGHASFARGESFYEAYSRLAGGCRPTAYAMSNRNEEFAEVFAAFLTHPELLSGGDAACKRAYAFFSRDVFVANGELASCAPEARRVLLARAGGAGEVMVADSRRANPSAAERAPRVQDTPNASGLFGRVAGGGGNARDRAGERRVAQGPPVWDDDAVPPSPDAARVRREQAQNSNPWVFGSGAPEPEDESSPDGEESEYRERDREQLKWLWGQ